MPVGTSGTKHSCLCLTLISSRIQMLRSIMGYATLTITKGESFNHPGRIWRAEHLNKRKDRLINLSNPSHSMNTMGACIMKFHFPLVLSIHFLSFLHIKQFMVLDLLQIFLVFEIIAYDGWGIFRNTKQSYSS